MHNQETAPTEEQVKKYRYLLPMLNSAHTEMREFAKKKQDGIVSKTKVQILNRLLRELREVLAAEESISYLDLLDEEEFPQNSDAVIILGQYQAALKSFVASHNQHVPGHGHVWLTKEWLEENGSYDEEDQDEDDEGFEDDENQ